MASYRDHDAAFPQRQAHNLRSAAAGPSSSAPEPIHELRRNASVPAMGLPRLLPRTSSMCLPRGRRLPTAETEGVQSWDEYQSIREAQAARRPAARRSLGTTLEVAARTHPHPITGAAQRAAGALDTLGPSTGAYLQGGMPAIDPGLLPLQHLLLSPAASALSMLDVKAIICKVAADLDTLHAQRSLHRHVSVACIAVPASGALPASCLLPHGANIRCLGRGGAAAAAPVAFQGMEPYLAPELAIIAAGKDRCSPAMHTPACDMWSLGVVLFVMLSGSHVPFGNRGLGQTSIPNMPGKGESVDALQAWLQEHLDCKMGVVNAMAAGCADTAACRDMRVLGFDPGAGDLVLGLLRADPAQRLSAHAVVRHAWLAEVVHLPGTLGWLAKPTGLDLGAGGAHSSATLLAALHPVVLLGGVAQVAAQPVALTPLPPPVPACTPLADGTWWIPVPEGTYLGTGAAWSA